jgi:hypothetical protein
VHEIADSILQVFVNETHDLMRGRDEEGSLHHGFFTYSAQ